MTASAKMLSGPLLEKALSRLSRCLGSKLVTERDQLAPFLTDDSPFLGHANAVVLAESEEDLRVALREAEALGLPVTPRAGGSGRTGGAVPQGGLVLSTRGMNSIVEIDTAEGLAVVEPGVLLSDLHAAVEAEGWFYPPDPNSADLCCLGGNVAENAAGPRALKYGTTRDYVLGVEAVLMGGTQVFSGRRTKKGVTGYDTTALLVGSEGTLATFGRITLRLIPKPEGVMTLLVLFRGMTEACAAVSRLVAERVWPRCIEFLDRKTLEVMRAAGNPLSLEAGSLLLIEVDGSESECERQAEIVGNVCDREGALEVLVAQTESQRSSLWAARKNMSVAVRQRAKFKLSEDVVVPRRQLGTLVRSVEELGEKHQIDALCYGHAGDGNLHVNFLWDDDEQKRRVDAAVVELFKKTIELRGTLSGEHGIGLSKAPFLSLEQPSELRDLQKRLKSAFDPQGLMNPGKIFAPQGHGPC